MTKKRKLFAEEIEKILKLKNRQGELVDPDNYPKSKKVISTYTVGKMFGVSQVTIHKIWKGTYEWQKIPIDVKLAEKLIKFFSDSEVRENIPDTKKEEFFANLNEVEQKRVGQIIRGY